LTQGLGTAANGEQHSSNISQAADAKDQSDGARGALDTSNSFVRGNLQSFLDRNTWKTKENAGMMMVHENAVFSPRSNAEDSTHESLTGICRAALPQHRWPSHLQKHQACHVQGPPQGARRQDVQETLLGAKSTYGITKAELLDPVAFQVQSNSTCTSPLRHYSPRCAAQKTPKAVPLNQLLAEMAQKHAQDDGMTEVRTCST
jgi:hypothetical protein